MNKEGKVYKLQHLFHDIPRFYLLVLPNPMSSYHHYYHSQVYLTIDLLEDLEY